MLVSGPVTTTARRWPRRGRRTAAVLGAALLVAGCGGHNAGTGTAAPPTRAGDHLRHSPGRARAGATTPASGGNAPSLTTTTLPPGVTEAPWQGSLFTRGDVASWPLDPSSAQFAADIVADYQAHYGSVGVNTMPVYTVPAGAPMVPVTPTPGCNDFLASTGPTVPLPAGLHLNASPDDPLAVYQPSTGRDWELWQAHLQPSGGLSACWGGMLDVYGSSGVFPAPFGLSATGISYLATVITQQDLLAGRIDHALALEVPRCNYWVYPADRGDCGPDPGQPPEGQWFRFPAGLAEPPGLTPFAQMVFRALQTYGMVVTDQAGAVMLQAEQPQDWTAQGHQGQSPLLASWQGLSEYQVVADLPWASLQAVDPPG